jgi:hypothetical protein
MAACGREGSRGDSDGYSGGAECEHADVIGDGLLCDVRSTQLFADSTQLFTDNKRAADSPDEPERWTIIIGSEIEIRQPS